jgi:3-oxoadipate enol-lactonase
VTRVTVGDLSLAVAVDGDRSAPPLVLVHSAGTDHRMWDRNVPALDGRFRLIRYDLRGHGRSDVPPPPYRLDDLGRDLVGVLDALDVTTSHVVGASLGGMIALWLAARHPERVDRAAFAGTAARIGTAEGWQQRADAVRLGGTDAVVELVMRRYFSDGFRRDHADVVARFADVLRRQPADGYMGTCLALRDADLRGEIGRVRAPSLVIVGTEDVSTPPSDAERLRASIPGARGAVLDGAGHLCTVERPDTFREIAQHLMGEA